MGSEKRCRGPFSGTPAGFATSCPSKADRLYEAGSAHQPEDEQDQDQEDYERIGYGSEAGHQRTLLIGKLSVNLMLSVAGALLDFGVHSGA